MSNPWALASQVIFHHQRPLACLLTRPPVDRPGLWQQALAGSWRRKGVLAVPRLGAACGGIGRRGELHVDNLHRPTARSRGLANEP
jgi:hypothetical protein